MMRNHLSTRCFGLFLRFFGLEFRVDFGPVLRCEVGFEEGDDDEFFFAAVPNFLFPHVAGFADEVFLVFDGMVPRYVALRTLTKTLCEYPLDSYF